jgi:uncharacterized protein
MDITPVIAESRQLIEAYGNGGFRIAGADYTGSVLIFPGETLAWPLTDVTALTLEHLAPAFERAAEIELLLIGTGKTHGFISPRLKEEVRRRGIVIDSMDTGAACRTFNVLLAEERRVAAALIAQ